MTINVVGWGTPANFNVFRVLASLLHRRRSAEANQALHDIWRSSALVRYYIRFRGSCQQRFWQVQNSLCVQVLRSPTSAAVLHGTRAVGVSQTLLRGTRNKITEFSQRATYTLGRAAIRLGMGPHSSFCSIKL